MPENPHPTTPLDPALGARLDRYLDDLGRMLAVASPVDRADALGSVREYIDDSLGTLGHPATDDDVTAILDALGSPEDVAAGLIDGGIVSPSGPPTGAPSSPAAPPASGDPAAAAAAPGDPSATGALVAGIAAILLPVAGLALGIVAIVLGRKARREGTARASSASAGTTLGIIALVLHTLLILVPIGMVTLRAGIAESSSDSVVVTESPGRTVPTAG